jgi:hypothetical protein
MKFFLITAVIVSITPLGLGQSAAQTDMPSPGTIGATSPLGSDFGRPLGNSPTGMPSQGDVGATSPLGADFGQPFGDNSQITPAPYTDVTNPAPCTSGGPGAVALSPFDGSGLSPTSGGLSPTTGFTTSGIGAANTMSAPCNSVSSSSGVTGSLNFANSAATAPSANASAPTSPVSLGLGTRTTPTATTSPNTKGLGVTALGTSGLGTTGLGTTGLGSLPGQSASTLQTITSPSTATQAETSCSGDLAAPPLNPGTVTAQSLSGGVPDRAQSLGGSATDAAQRLGGTARVPAMPVPCPTTSTMP